MKDLILLSLSLLLPLTTHTSIMMRTREILPKHSRRLNTEPAEPELYNSNSILTPNTVGLSPTSEVTDSLTIKVDGENQVNEQLAEETQLSNSIGPSLEEENIEELPSIGYGESHNIEDEIHEDVEQADLDSIDHVGDEHVEEEHAQEEEVDFENADSDFGLEDTTGVDGVKGDASEANSAESIEKLISNALSHEGGKNPIIIINTSGAQHHASSVHDATHIQTGVPHDANQPSQQIVIVS